MARARNLKPSMFKNEILGVADPLLTILFQGLWVLADREGRLEDRPLRIKAEVFPYRDMPKIGEMLQWLHENGFIDRYTVDGDKFIQVCAFSRHQNPHRNEVESRIPEKPANTGPVAIVDPNNEVLSTKDESASAFIGSARALTLNPLPLTFNLNPSTLNPSTPNPSCCAEASPPTRQARAKRSAENSPSKELWGSYESAYLLRYGVLPVRNARVNSQLAQFIGRVGEVEAPAIARFYVGHQNSFYVRDMHGVGLMLKDAEKLRTEWATNTRMTNTQANQADKTQTNLNAFQTLIDREERKQANGEH